LSIGTTSPSLETEGIATAFSVRAHLIQEGLFRPAHSPEETSQNTPPSLGNDTWRIATTPFLISREDHAFIETLGPHLLSFYKAANRLYFESLRGQVPAWYAAYLDKGKPAGLLETARMNRFKQRLPGIIRPDLIPTEDGMIASELDAVPGGMGLNAALAEAYTPHRKNNSPVIGGHDGMIDGFERMVRANSAQADPLLVIVVSQESKSYQPEMAWLANRLKARGLRTVIAEPKAVLFSEEGLLIDIDRHHETIDVLYRFFELFDLKNVPKSELILYAAKKKKVVLTPPPKPALEEKSLFALFHHPLLKTHWQRHLKQETLTILEKLFPQTWILDPSPLPPHAVIPGLTLSDVPVNDFRQLGAASQKSRRYVIKPSGFSELAWGGRGVSMGHDLSEEDWRETIDESLDQFQSTPYILQKFHKGRKVAISYYDFRQERIINMKGRVRLSPYYFVEGDKVHLGGILATVCGLEKKLIHGMVDAVMAPCAIADQAL